MSKSDTKMSNVFIPPEIFIPPRHIVKHGDRWIIYLPKSHNEIWEAIKDRKLKVKAYLIVDESGE